MRPPKVSKALLTETALKAQLARRLRAAGYTVYVTSERRRGYSKMPIGLPDLFVMHGEHRMACWVEVKVPGERLRPAQARFRDAALRAGIQYWLIDSLVDIDLRFPGVARVAA